MSHSTPAQQAAAESKFAKTKAKADDAASSMALHEKVMKQQRSNTERLKALRLARDDAQVAPEPEKPATRRRKSDAKP